MSSQQKTPTPRAQKVVHCEPLTNKLPAYGDRWQKRWEVMKQRLEVAKKVIGQIEKKPTPQKRKQPAESLLYKVEPGDGWLRVAEKFGVSAEALQAANPLLLKRSDNWLYLGDTLLVPGKSYPAAPDDLAKLLDPNAEILSAEASQILARIKTQLLHVEANYRARRRVACQELLTELEKFSVDAFTRFHKIFWTTSPTGASPNDLEKKLASTPNSYPANYVINLLLEQVATDLALITQIQAERSGESKEMVTASDKEPSNAQLSLICADLLGNRSLAPIHNNKLLKRPYTAALSYFSSRVSVRLLPYHGAALIAIPNSALIKFVATIEQGQQYYQIDIPVDFLAIPHEIGHLLYRFGTSNDRPIRATLEEETKGLTGKRWLEELFADAYACFVAGPIAVVGFQEYLISNQEKAAFDDDEGNEDDDPHKKAQYNHQHPDPRLRPLLQTRILQKIIKSFGDETDKSKIESVVKLLDERWQYSLQEHWAMEESKSKSVQAKLPNYDKLIQKIVDQFGKDFTQKPLWENWQPDQESLVNDNQLKYDDYVATLYRNFVVDTLNQAIQGVGSGDPGGGSIPENSGEAEKLANPADPGNPMDQNTDHHIRSTLIDGWATKGPGPGQVSG